ncbi:Hypothetical predicted protein [Pelobates cultripes]|uniref:Uncharacterized protein n=1 Tax=Pelobates cultripes TaxID=61616 RepID=A0AAD1RHV8_PELCU|nr:Hypothetical predicted protein [Pelobates cultripes]
MAERGLMAAQATSMQGKSLLDLHSDFMQRLEATFANIWSQLEQRLASAPPQLLKTDGGGEILGSANHPLGTANRNTPASPNKRPRGPQITQSLILPPRLSRRKTANRKR